MDSNIITQLQEFEAGQKAVLEDKKKQFLTSIEDQRKELLTKQAQQIEMLESSKKNELERSKNKARDDALSTIKEYREKTEQLQKIASRKSAEAVDMIFNEFLNQHV